MTEPYIYIVTIDLGIREGYKCLACGYRTEMRSNEEERIKQEIDAHIELAHKEHP